MPFYQTLSPATSPDDKRIVEKLLALRVKLKEEIPEKTLDETLLVATWNIRDFDKPTFGKRLKESFFYIAEIIARFDIVAVQEVYKDLKALDEVMRVLGSDWDYLFSDATEGAQGNNECIAFVFDKRKVRFGGLAGELVIPADKDNPNPPQFWRTPLICGFRAGWAKFMICSVHILWGKQKGKNPPQERIDEIRRLAQFLKKRTEDKSAWARKLILLGDFNIGKQGDETYLPLQEAGFIAPPPLQEIYTNVAKDKQYDQILFRELENSLAFKKGGTFDYYSIVFKEEEEPIYRPFMKKKADENETAPQEIMEVDDAQIGDTKYYKSWRTHQMSDHLPLWVEFKIDFSDAYLQKKLDDEA